MSRPGPILLAPGTNGRENEPQKNLKRDLPAVTEVIPVNLPTNPPYRGKIRAFRDSPQCGHAHCPLASEGAAPLCRRYIYPNALRVWGESHLEQ